MAGIARTCDSAFGFGDGGCFRVITMHDDRALLREFAADHTEAAFAEVVRRHIDAVYSAALRRLGGDRVLAEDVTQEVFVALARKAAIVSRHPVLSGWLHITTRNAAANAVRSEQRRHAREQKAHAMREILSEPEPTLDWNRVAPVLDAALDALNSVDRAALLLRYVERRSFDEIAVTLQLSNDAARMRVNRALEKLRAGLARHGITSTSAALSVALVEQAVVAAPPALTAAVITGAAAVTPGAFWSAVSLLEFMTTAKIVGTVAALAVLAAVGTATRERVIRRDAEAALAATQAEQTVLAAKLRTANQRLAAVEDETRELERALAAARVAQRAELERQSKTRTSVAAAMSGPATPEAIAAGQSLMERDPELKQAVLNYCHALFSSMFGRLYRERNFTAEQIAQFERFMAMGSGVLRRVVGPNGEPVVIAGADFGNQEKKRQAEQALAWIGPEGGQQMRQLMTQDRGQALTVQLAGALAFSNAQLTPAQAQEFTRIVVAAGGRSGTGTFAWDPILAQAADLLSEPQLAMLRGFQLQEQYQLAMNDAMRRRGQSAATNSAGGKP